eukprot:gnl/Trimastix_PCT/3048.p1 GENE.gnl/Trimastix_PCT/3048~~gnl/Trimastix_PCT/3048.p1  ORF type:complete len:226 (-),score=24.30 gnl/Trimastix_PCT/3048:51-728(-)
MRAQFFLTFIALFALIAYCGAYPQANEEKEHCNVTTKCAAQFHKCTGGHFKKPYYTCPCYTEYGHCLRDWCPRTCREERERCLKMCLTRECDLICVYEKWYQTTAFTIVLFIISIISEFIATVCMKASDGFKNLIPSVLVFLCYGFAIFGLSIAFKKLPMAIAYATFAAVGNVFVFLAGTLFWKESRNWLKVLGLILVVIGIVGANLSGMRVFNPPPKILNNTLS